MGDFNYLFFHAAHSAYSGEKKDEKRLFSRERVDGDIYCGRPAPPPKVAISPWVRLLDEEKGVCVAEHTYIRAYLLYAAGQELKAFIVFFSSRQKLSHTIPSY